MTYEERQYLRNARSDYLKSLRRRDSRTLSDVQKSVKIREDQLVAEETLAGQVQWDAIDTQEHVLS